jgi:hypothetical protein
MVMVVSGQLLPEVAGSVKKQTSAIKLQVIAHVMFATHDGRSLPRAIFRPKWVKIPVMKITCAC